MKSFLALLSIVAAAFAQTATITYPPNGTTVTMGSNFTVQVTQSDAGSDRQTAIILGVIPCSGETDCSDIPLYVGDFIYNSPFDPVYPSAEDGSLYQNFTVQVSSDFYPPGGPAILSLTHLMMTGAANERVYEVSAIIVDLVSKGGSPT